MTHQLRHNTSIEGALAILANRCVRAQVEIGRKYGSTLIHGPYFFVEDMPVDEVRTGGEHGDANLYFDCDLPVLGVLSSRLSAALVPGENGDPKPSRAQYEGQLLLCYRTEQSNGTLTEFREAVILPFVGKNELLPDCLRLTKYDPEDLFRSAPLLRRRKLKEAADTAITERQLFSVGIRYA